MEDELKIEFEKIHTAILRLAECIDTLEEPYVARARDNDFFISKSRMVSNILNQ